MPRTAPGTGCGRPPPHRRDPLVETRILVALEAKAELQNLIDRLSDEDALKLLDFVNNLSDPDTLTGEEMAELLVIEAEMEAGDFVTLAEFKEKYGA